MFQEESAPYREEALRLARLDWPVMEASVAAFSDPEALVGRSLREVLASMPNAIRGWPCA